MILRDVGAGAAAGGCRVRPNHPLFAGLSERAWIEAPHPIGPRAVAVWKMRHDGALSARLKVQIAGASVLATLCKDGDTGMGAGGLPLATSFAPLRRAARSGAVL